jgi:glutamate-5-semialdehyde dehydrogenase
LVARQQFYHERTEEIMSDREQELILIGQRAKAAARVLAYTGTAAKNQALTLLAAKLEQAEAEILAANAEDVKNAKAKDIAPTLINRLTLDSAGVQGIAASVREVIELPDPVGQGEFWTRPNGLRIEKTHVPLGVLAIIYEARPNVTVDAAALCLKSGNACILRGGSEALQGNLVLARLIAAAVAEAGLPEGSVQLLPWTDRQYAVKLMCMNEYVDVVIPRGGASLIRTVLENATVPVIETGTGVCHAYVDKDADVDKAIKVLVNAKTDNPSVCNALETLLVHRDIAPDFLPQLAAHFIELGVEIRACEPTRALLPATIPTIPATAEDWRTEYNDLIISVKIVTDLDEALHHIYTYGTGHSETILTENYTTAQRFLREVDAAAVYVNASTRFTDGGRFGFGAEIGISTQKLHARGPMGLAELTTVKYMIYGDGQIV